MIPSAVPTVDANHQILSNWLKPATSAPNTGADDPVLMPGCASPPTGFLELLTWVDLSKQATILEQADSLSATGIRSRHSNRNTGTFAAKPFSCRSPTATKRAASSSQSSRTSPEMRSHWRQLRCKADKRTAPWRRTDHYVRLRVHRRGCQSGHSGSLKRRRKAAGSAGCRLRCAQRSSRYRRRP